MYDDLIRRTVEKHFPSLLKDFGPDGWLWIKAQVRQESAFNPRAKSDANAMGLMQIVPSTWKGLNGGDDPYNPEQNVRAGVRFMADLYGDFGEIDTPFERMAAALASYNGGKGYPNVALALARDAEGLPYGFAAWNKSGRPDGRWQTFDFWGSFLADPRCKVKVKGRFLRPDHRQIRGYVGHIRAFYGLYVKHSEKP